MGKWGKLKSWNMTLDAGDCAFVPTRWYHFVEAEKQRSISVHIWFGAGNKFSDKSCEEIVKRGIDPKTQHLSSLGDCTWGWSREKAKSATHCKVHPKKEEL